LIMDTEFSHRFAASAEDYRVKPPVVIIVP
jgi:hypothetical protein